MIQTSKGSLRIKRKPYTPMSAPSFQEWSSKPRKDFTPVSDEPEADFRELAGAALHNAGIDTEEQLQAVQEGASNVPVNVHQLAVVEADEDEIVYKITFDLPDAGLPGEGQSQLQVPLGNDWDNTTIAPIVPVDTDAPEVPLQCYPTRSCRSANGN